MYNDEYQSIEQLASQVTPMKSLFGGFEFRLKQWLHRQYGEEWCLERNVLGRTFNELINDAELRPLITGWSSEVTTQMAVAADREEQERRANRQDLGIDRDEWGTGIHLDPPHEMFSLDTMETLPELTAAFDAIHNWTYGVKRRPDLNDLDDMGEIYPPFLVLNGIPGCGKTRLAKGACAALWGRTPVLFITEGEMVQSLHGGLANGNLAAIEDDLKTIPALILDDYGAAALTVGSWGHGKRDEVLSHRWEMDFRTMITTNWKSSEIKANSPRLASRMMDRTKAVNVAIQAKDYRQKVR
jgi:hypothetical protein